VQGPVRLSSALLESRLVCGMADFLELNGFAFAFAGRGQLATVPFESVYLGAADAAGEANLAAHRCSNFL
jgi:hypothetical protein